MIGGHGHTARIRILPCVDQLDFPSIDTCHKRFNSSNRARARFASRANESSLCCRWCRDTLRDTLCISSRDALLDALRISSRDACPFDSHALAQFPNSDDNSFQSISLKFHIYAHNLDRINSFMKSGRIFIPVHYGIFLIIFRYPHTWYNCTQTLKSSYSYCFLRLFGPPSFVVIRLRIHHKNVWKYNNINIL